uniref:Uncharacterized protein n=1 Tax=Arundo donax TaxID=35708 RepID=A0A0A9F8A5_ARUDO
MSTNAMTPIAKMNRIPIQKPRVHIHTETKLLGTEFIFTNRRPRGHIIGLPYAPELVILTPKGRRPLSFKLCK